MGQFLPSLAALVILRRAPRGASFHLALAAGLLHVGSAATAQEMPLKGINTVSVLVSDLRDSAKSCGLDQTELKEVPIHPLSGSRIKLTPEGAPISMAYYIEIGALQPTSNLCTGSIGISLWDLQPITAHGTTQYRKVTYWSVAYDVAASRESFPNVVKDDIEAATKLFIAQWSQDQK